MQPITNVLNHMLQYKCYSKVLDNSDTLSQLLKLFDYAIEKLVPKAFIKLRIASFYTQISSSTLCENFAMEWFTSLFSNALSDSMSLHVLDMFLVGGWGYILRFGLALIKVNEGIGDIR